MCTDEVQQHYRLVMFYLLAEVITMTILVILFLWWLNQYVNRLIRLNRGTRETVFGRDHAVTETAERDHGVNKTAGRDHGVNETAGRDHVVIKTAQRDHVVIKTAQRDHAETVDYGFI